MNQSIKQEPRAEFCVDKAGIDRAEDDDLQRTVRAIVCGKPAALIWGRSASIVWEATDER